MRFLNTILLVLILVAVCAGGALLYFGKLGVMQPAVQALPADQPAQAEPAATPIFLALDPFTVTLQDPYLPQILYLEITVRVADQGARNYLIEYMPEVRNRILTELSRHSAARVQQTDGRITLAENLRKAIAAPYPPRSMGPDVISVLFTAFVVQ